MPADKFAIVSDKSFRTMLPILHLSRLFGLQPLQWRQMNGNHVITKSTTYLIYSNVMVFTLVFTTVFTLTLLFQDEVFYNIRLAKPMQSYITYCDIGVILAPSVAGVLITSLKIDRYVEYMGLLNRADRLLEKYRCQYWKHVLVSTATITYASAILLFEWIMWLRQNRNPYSPGFLCLPFYLCYYFTIVMELMYWQLVRCIKCRLTVMNECLLETSASRNPFPEIDRKTSGKLFPTVKTAASNRLDRIRDLFEVYDCLREAANHVNDCYGFVILMVLLGCFIQLLVTPYNMYAAVKNTGNTIYVVSHMIWMCGHVLRLFLIVEPCHGCLDEVNNTYAIICKLLASNENGEIKEFLQIFAMYLHRCKIVFTALGITRLSRKILSNIAAAVTTYLVIILQFYEL